MARGLDHIVHAVRDLDAAAALYRGLGFTVGARNRHPWGTHNHIIQFPGFFIELLTLAEPDKLGRDGFSILFGAAADAANFRSAGIAGSQVMRFEREGKRPDGSPVKLGFSLVFADDKLAPRIHFATCQQHYPENFWNAALQRHANGAQAVAGVVVVANEPERHLNFMQNFNGASGVTTGDNGFCCTTPRGTIEMVTPDFFLHRYGVVAPDVSRGPRIAALRLVVIDAGRLQAVPELAGIAGLYAGSATVIGREDALGAVLVFEPGN